ncbi:hypothetical protein SERLA73DRAFT_189195 [Serpula lacrymans var. lacrymans S7.3]|uniref:Uncharacterized protein n=2 Tax=Serpula lacrymans var. lacrymans TaxID=341189 RepID=F8QD23_SERL3|nr:uncharacterized protein SERLADRAFT_479904 [Serpula lacrymans var. lacrymans S7.9]EGN94038.1 hypothetical protein SERLA73DRAFT_189195 [Serpula lacrymans var. lacrymans S7.3]EGO19387.1 hypothetical protein SERLADRAFT_479904 [Serpula lacrymans var. lacrymans S7.9]
MYRCNTLPVDISRVRRALQLISDIYASRKVKELPLDDSASKLSSFAWKRFISSCNRLQSNCINGSCSHQTFDRKHLFPLYNYVCMVTSPPCSSPLLLVQTVDESIGSTQGVIALLLTLEHTNFFMKSFILETRYYSRVRVDHVVGRACKHKQIGTDLRCKYA